MRSADAKEEHAKPQAANHRIAVIADDFTGAAELAGISLRYGLTVDISLGKAYPSSADVFIVCSDSRSMTKEAAMQATAAIIKEVLPLQPILLYKKIDSVLRGYVLDEIILQMNLSKKTKAFVAAANPSLGRTISNGSYFIEGRKITETGFAADPEFPISTASVKQMLGGSAVQVLKPTDYLPEDTVIICEAMNTEDTAAWAGLKNDETLLAGAGDFYNELLQIDYQLQPASAFSFAMPHLYVCGTAFAERRSFISSLHATRQCVCFIPAALNDAWMQQVSKILRDQKKLLLAIGETQETAIQLRTRMATVVRDIVQQEKIQEIFIEGGSTAAAVLQALGISRLQAVNELQRGVVRMRAGNLHITVKPGSYPLPKEILELY